ncbi:hypothetical protein BRYFOR_06054 [Marvinbryantia formatexigens DSM 14469]|uniref:C2H2-type domain-containing protein n=1 Tax=Marvinbryantia formatexigens DSM 14469 TaxID=478749 RepID=C6LBQ9_9FIRM|nr:hypothetical protein [Marvinbryantia formatexigens]EET61862.1 hypothetical protein BRYFOR_06054 [Marvinbryantia formatexigens DSM 14469]UWO25783.1 hypothetical protein NQ534_04705 [Marvinbryantia formatexigens DSM 14469]SDF36979.1 hypothetical protein SAMN05660368_00585 [Marvinbryantia formatexigens]
MAKKGRLLFLLALCGMLSLTGCRKKAEETESETTTVSETESESETEKETEKTTEKKSQNTSVKNTTETEKTTVKASAAKPSTTGSSTQTESTAQTENSAGTAQCPYCYQQISLASNGDGTTVYSVHVAQEKAWADMYGYGDTPPANQQQTNAQQTEAQQTDAPSGGTDDSQQCGYCYQWFSVSDGSYAAHLAQENASLGLPQGTEYVQCPTCGYSFPKGSLYDNHVCVTN